MADSRTVIAPDKEFGKSRRAAGCDDDSAISGLMEQLRIHSFGAAYSRRRGRAHASAQLSRLYG